MISLINFARKRTLTLGILNFKWLSNVSRLHLYVSYSWDVFPHHLYQSNMVAEGYAPTCWSPSLCKKHGPSGKLKKCRLNKSQPILYGWGGEGTMEKRDAKGKAWLMEHGQHCDHSHLPVIWSNLQAIDLGITNTEGDGRLVSHSHPKKRISQTNFICFLLHGLTFHTTFYPLF